MSAQRRRCEKFRALHGPGTILVLPNAWDAASARLVEHCGAAAIATSSAAVAWAHGYPDGEAIPADVLLACVEEIVRVVDVPVSVDGEGGYSSDPGAVAEFVCTLIDAGAVGMNVEDGHGSPESLERKIDAIRKAAARRGFDFFISARTDVYLHRLVAPEAALGETLARGRRYRDAGADGVFVPALTNPESLRALADEISLPLNVLITRGLPSVSELKAAGVRRVSAGAGLSRAALGATRRAASQLIGDGRYDALFEEAEACPNLNALLTSR